MIQGPGAQIAVRLRYFYQSSEFPFTSAAILCGWSGLGIELDIWESMGER